MEVAGEEPATRPLPPRAVETLGEEETMYEEDEDKGSRVSRRRFMAAAGGMAVGASAVGAPAAGARVAKPPRRWDRQVDVVVVGSGAAAYSAALTASAAGRSVVMLEKASGEGGTSAKSGGGYWIPNNSHMRKRGLTDPRADALKLLTRLSWPARYAPGATGYGLPAREASLLAAFYDNGPKAIDQLTKLGYHSTFAYVKKDGDEPPFPDYYAELPENKAPYGRILAPLTPSGGGFGADMIAGMKAVAGKRHIPLLLKHHVTSAVVNSAGQVIGVLATKGRKTVAVRGKRGVIFGSGGFTQNPEMALNFLRGPIFGGCAVPTNTGDFVDIGIDLGADLGNMNNAWWAGVVFEQALQFSSTPSDVFNIPGHSMIVVDRAANRLYNEKFVYNERTQVHFLWDPLPARYKNLLTFMIYDQATADTYGGIYPLPAKGATAPYVIAGATLAELAQKIGERLGSHTRRTGGFDLDAAFAAQLPQTVARFNGFATAGKDDDFQRGERLIERYFDSGVQSAKPPAGTTMAPISDSGPYYCIILGGGTLDTKGGPKTNAKAQVLDTRGKPIRGLYGAGNCIAAPAGQAYWSGGATLGSAITFGHIAAKNASKEAVKPV
jgi:3-oxosteroid 1-dehydrogenase